MRSIQSLFVLLLLVIATTTFVLQDLPLERFERSGHSDELMAPALERQSRGLFFRPAANMMAKYRMFSG